MKIAFHSNQLCERGSEVALYDYAYYNEKILKNNSLIISKKDANLESFTKFKDRFNVFLYKDFSEVDQILRKEKTDVFYAIKDGKRDGIESKICKTVIHCMFDLDQPHGDVYAAISYWLSQEKSNGKTPVVPHMVNLPNIKADLRNELGISNDEIVLGRYGGYGTFDLKFAHEAIKRALKKRKDIVFLFQNTSKFCDDHPQIIRLPQNTDMLQKVKFINTCDAMLHAREQGETFGLAIGEFSIKNKPIITWNGSRDKAHLDILGNKAIKYSNEEDLYTILINISKDKLIGNDWDCYSNKYCPETVMDKFNKIFLS